MPRFSLSGGVTMGVILLALVLVSVPAHAQASPLLCDPDRVYVAEELIFPFAIPFTVTVTATTGLVINTFTGTFALLMFDGKTGDGQFRYVVTGILGDLC